MDTTQAPLASHAPQATTSGPADAAARRWQVLTVVGFSMVVALIAGDAPALVYVPGAVAALLPAFEWQRRTHTRGTCDGRDAVPWVASMVCLGAVAALLSPLAWPWVAVFGLFACAVQLPLIRRIG